MKLANMLELKSNVDVEAYYHTRANLVFSMSRFNLPRYSKISGKTVFNHNLQSFKILIKLRHRDRFHSGCRLVAPGSCRQSPLAALLRALHQNTNPRTGAKANSNKPYAHIQNVGLRQCIRVQRAVPESQAREYPTKAQAL